MVSQNRIEVRIGADTKGAEQGIDRVQNRTNKLRDNAKRMGVAFTAAGAAITGAMAASVKTFVDAGDEIEKMSRRTNIGTTTLSELRHAAQLSGTEITSLEVGIRRMSSSIADADDGLSTAVLAFEKLGVNIDTIKTQSVEDQLMTLMMALADVEEGYLQSALAQDLFGRSGTALLPMVDQGAEALQAMRDQAHDLGLVFDQQTAAQAAALADAMTNLKGSMQGVMIEVGSQLAPILETLADKLTVVVTEIRQWIEENPELAKTVAALGVGLLAFGATTITVAAMMIPLAAATTAAFAPMVIAAGILTAFIAAYTTNFLGIRDITNTVAPAIGKAIMYLINDVFGPFIDTFKFIENNWRDMVNFMTAHLETGVNFIIGELNRLIEGFNRIPFTGTIDKIEELEIATKLYRRQAIHMTDTMYDDLLPAMEKLNKETQEVTKHTRRSTEALLLNARAASRVKGELGTFWDQYFAEAGFITLENRLKDIKVWDDLQKDRKKESVALQESITKLTSLESTLLKTVEDQNRVINDLQKDRNAMLEKENKLIADGIQLRDPSQLPPNFSPGLGMGFNFGRTASDMKIAVLDDKGQVIGTRLGTKETGGKLLKDIDPELAAKVNALREAGSLSYNELDALLETSTAVREHRNRDITENVMQQHLAATAVKLDAVISINGQELSNELVPNVGDG